MITLDGWKVPGYGTKINAGVKVAGEDLSGYGSFSLSSDNGVKAGVLSVTVKIKHDDAAQLAELIAKAKALDENGARIVRTVNSTIAEAYKIRKVKFDGEISASEDETLKIWTVSFKLVEVKSKSEREQQQIDGLALENSTGQATSGHENIQKQFENVEGP